ncbi:hypothetical protein ES702_05966 [subsurface metagenome]
MSIATLSPALLELKRLTKIDRVRLKCSICGQDYSIRVNGKEGRKIYTPEVREKYICLLCK